MFGLVRSWKRKRLAKRPFPEEWMAYVTKHAAFYEFLSEAARQRFLRKLKVFAWEKHFIAAGGMEITDEVKVVISAAAVRLVLNLGLSYYDRLTEIVVYPGHYRHPDDDGDFVVFGEAHHWGTVVLSYEAVLHGLANHSDGHDTATHEFAHVLDRAGGAFDGTPLLHALQDYRPWASVMSHHFERLQEGNRPERRVMRSYGATNEAEFFAVATESFFEKPIRMHRETPELYETLKQFYRCDPLERRRQASGRRSGKGTEPA